MYRLLTLKQSYEKFGGELDFLFHFRFRRILKSYFIHFTYRLSLRTL